MGENVSRKREFNTQWAELALLSCKLTVIVSSFCDLRLVFFSSLFIANSCSICVYKVMRCSFQANRIALPMHFSTRCHLRIKQLKELHTNKSGTIPFMRCLTKCNCISFSTLVSASEWVSCSTQQYCVEKSVEIGNRVAKDMPPFSRFNSIPFWSTLWCAKLVNRCARGVHLLMVKCAHMMYTVHIYIVGDNSELPFAIV